MSQASKHLLRPVTAVVMALGLALTAVGGTMAQEEHEVTIPSGSGGSGGIGGDTTSISVTVNDVPASDLRGKILRISVNPDGSY